MKLKLFLAAALIASGSSLVAAPTTYRFAGTLDYAGTSAPNDAWAFAAGQRFTGEIVWDAAAVQSEGFSIVDPNWTLRTFYSPIVSFSYSVETPAGYAHTVPTQNLSGSAWQYVAVASGAGGWDGADLRMMNYPQGWTANPPSAPLPSSAYVGDWAPHNVNFSLMDFGSFVLPSITPDLDLAALFASTGGSFSVRFSDPFAWTTGVERVDGSFIGTLTSVVRADAGVPEPATWALMLIGFGAAGATLRRRRLALA